MWNCAVTVCCPSTCRRWSSGNLRGSDCFRRCGKRWEKAAVGAIFEEEKPELTFKQAREDFLIFE